MIAFRIKHVPTGLYYIPGRSIVNPQRRPQTSDPWHVKSNLSTKGKVYMRTNPERFLDGWYKANGRAIYNHTRPECNGYNPGVTGTLKEEWVIEEVSGL